jgi:hypothetical protein
VAKAAAEAAAAVATEVVMMIAQLKPSRQQLRQESETTKTRAMKN